MLWESTGPLFLSSEERWGQWRQATSTITVTNWNIVKLTHLPARHSSKKYIQAAELNQGVTLYIVRTHHHIANSHQTSNTQNTRKKKTRRIGLVPCQACGRECLYVTKYVWTGNGHMWPERGMVVCDWVCLNREWSYVTKYDWPGNSLRTGAVFEQEIS